MSFGAKPLQSRNVVEDLIEGVKSFITRPHRTALVFEPVPARRASILEAIDGLDCNALEASDAKSAIATLLDRRVDCVILGPELLDGHWGFADALRAEPTLPRLPLIVYGERDALVQAGGALEGLGHEFPLRQVCSPDRLTDEAAFFLHTNLAKIPDATRARFEDLHHSDKLLASKKVLIVDDDFRNIFALSSVLEWRNMKVVSAETGRDAIALLQAQPDIDIVLMDIMMPEMDGMDTIRAIRKLAAFKSLPIIAVTAKAMKGDREKCIEAGAWDYLSKPVDTEQMLSVMRVWLHR